MYKKNPAFNQVAHYLDLLAFSLEGKGKLGLFDAHKLSEDFFAGLLNIIYGYELENLNKTNLNEAGLDLGDKNNRIAYQVTTDKTTAKVNHTLSKITEEQKEQYDEFKILIIGKKQGKYTVKKHYEEELGFNATMDLIDIRDLQMAIYHLPVKKVDEILSYLQTEIDVPVRESEQELVQEAIVPVLDNCNAMVTYQMEEHGVTINDAEGEQMLQTILEFFTRLGSLPSLTRKFYLELITRSEFNIRECRRFVWDNIMRGTIELSASDYDQQVQMLTHLDLIKITSDFEERRMLCLSDMYLNDPVLADVVEFIDYKGIDKKSVYVDIDLSCFAN